MLLLFFLFFFFFFSATMSVCLCLCVNFFPSKISQELLHAPRVFKFGIKIGYDMLYCVRQNHHPHANHFLYLSIFLFLL